MISFSPSRLAALVLKEFRETSRDWKMLSLTLTFAPFFVLLMYAYLGHSTPTYDIGVVNLDQGAVSESGRAESLGQELVAALRMIRSPEGDSILRIQRVDEGAAEELIETRVVDLVLFIPPGFSRAVLDARAGRETEPAPLRTRGDPGNPGYLMAAVWTDATSLGYVQFASGSPSPIVLAPETTSGATSLTEFDLYVPGLLALALMMLMFTAAGALIREKDKGTLIRLRLSNLTVFEWLTAVTTVQVIVGLLALALTYLTALAVGYRPQGSLPVVFLVGGLTSISIMAFSVVVAAFLRTIFDLVTVGCFPFFILMFFSGGMFPLPGVTLLHWGDRAVEINEVLPTTHAITAMNRVLSHGAGLGDIAYELSAVLVLTLFFFAVGTWVFTRRHMPAVG